MKITDITKNQILYLYDQGTSISKIKNIVKVSEPTISKIIKSSGRQVKKINYRALKIDLEKVVKLYAEGKSTYDIASIIGCSDETIRKLVKVRPLQERNKRSSDSIEKIRQKSLSLWQDADYKKAVIAATSKKEYVQSLSVAGKANYERSLGKWIKNPESSEILSSLAKKKWLESEYRDKQQKWFAERGERLSNAAKSALTIPDKREKWLAKLRASSARQTANRGWVSTSQKQLYYVLEHSNIAYYEEGDQTMIGPFYTVDCIIPKQQNMTKDLIVEVQGEYWHSLPHVIIKDRQKATYIDRYTDYDLLQLKELSLLSFEDLADSLAKYGLSLAYTFCETSEVIIKKISEKEAQLFYSIFHYSSTVRKGAITYGAFIGSELVAAISYTYPLRRTTANRYKVNMSEIMEISRLARKTNLKCKNLCSYFISKTRKLLPKEVRILVSFSDLTYGHSGTVYAAAGFTNDGIVEPDYYYASLTGKYHKKTIWDRAKKFKMSEDDYAHGHGLVKVNTDAKVRWIYNLK